MKNFRCLLFVVAAVAAFTSSPVIAGAPPADYPRYKLVDLGTLGGPNALQVFPAVTLNNHGEVIAQAGTAAPDPFSSDFWIQDGFIWHAILGTGNGAVRDLGGLNGNQSLPGWIADNGLIAGLGENGLMDDLAGFPQLRALLWTRDHSVVDLGTLGGNTSQGSAVNTRGQVVGTATNAIPENPDMASFFNGFLPSAQQVRAFLWERGAMRDLGTLGGNNAASIAINERGDVVGFSATDNAVNDSTGLPTIHPFVWRNEQMIDLGTLGGTMATSGSFVSGPWGHVINERGDVVGTSFLAGDANRHAFLWMDGHMIDLGTLGGNRSDGFAINDARQVVGRARTTPFPNSYHPFLWENGTMKDLGVAAPCTRGTAISINSQGQVVGGFGGCTDDPEQVGFARAFYWQKDSPIVDLNTLITPPSTILIDEATAINNRGEIVGAGILPDGSTRAVLLVPIPGR